MEEPRRFSLSQINAYLGCALKYRFQYVDQIPKPWRPAALAFGSSIHAAVEWLHKYRLAVGEMPPLPKVIEIFEADWYAASMDPLVLLERESMDGLRALGGQMLEVYFRAVNGTKPAAIEQPFELELADPTTGECLDVHFRGIVDLVEEDGTLVDLKTAARASSQEDVERHLQLSTYALVHFLQKDEIPKLRLDVLLKSRSPRLERYPTSRSIEDLAWTARLIQHVAQAIEAGHFFPNPTWRCTECEYFAHCQAWRGEEASEAQQLISIA